MDRTRRSGRCAWWPLQVQNYAFSLRLQVSVLTAECFAGRGTLQLARVQERIKPGEDARQHYGAPATEHRAGQLLNPVMLKIATGCPIPFSTISPRASASTISSMRPSVFLSVSICAP